MPLDPEVAAWLDRQKGKPSRGSMTVQQTREAYLRASAAVAVPADLARVEDLDLTPRLRGRLYWPAPDAALPILVWLHGGRFFSGGLDTHDSLCRALALAARCRVLAVGYRLAPEYRFPAAVEDTQVALEWAFSRSDRVAAGGDSAGGNLAAVGALLHGQARRPALRCQLLVYPMLDATRSLPSHRAFASGYGPGSADMQRGWHEYLPTGTDLHDSRVSPLFARGLEVLPPTFVLTAEFDSLRDEGEEFALRLRQNGVNASLRRYSGAIHGFFQMPGVLRLAREAIQDAGAFLAASL